MYIGRGIKKKEKGKTNVIVFCAFIYRNCIYVAARFGVRLSHVLVICNYFIRLQVSIQLLTN